MLDPAVIVDLEGNLVAINRRLTEITGFSENELVGESLLRTSFVSSRSRICLIRKCNETAARNDICTFDIEVNKKNGEKIYCEVKIKKIEFKGKVAELIILHNVTNKQNLQETLRESEERYRDLCEEARIIMLNLNLKGNICYANRIAESYGFIQKDVTGKTIFDYVNKKNRSKLVATHVGAISGKNVEAEFEIITLKGGFFVDYVGSPIRKAGAIIGCYVAMRDITDKKKMEKKLEKYADKLEKAVEKKTEALRRSEQELKLYSKHLEQLVEERTKKLREFERLATIGELAGWVGHDLRNPLAAIKNAAYFLKKKGALIREEQAEEMLEIIENGIDHSDKIINDLLDYARTMRLELQVNSVRNVLLDTLAMVRLPENVKVINTISEESTFRIDKNKIERVFINLAKNAIDAMPNGGTITLSCNQANDNIEITLADTGTGISDEILPKIFSPLFTTKAQGMGFGLAICKRIIEAHGGLITVETEVGKGTEFKVILPVEAKQTTDDKDDWITEPEYLLSTTNKKHPESARE